MVIKEDWEMWAGTGEQHQRRRQRRDISLKCLLSASVGDSGVGQGKR